MGTIKVNIPAILEANGYAVKAKNDVTKTKNTVKIIFSNIDPKISSRINGNQRAKSINSQLVNIENQINRIASTSANGVNKYRSTDQRLVSSINKIKTNNSVKKITSKNNSAFANINSKTKNK